MAKQSCSKKSYGHIEHPLYEGAWIAFILVSLVPYTLYHVLLHLLSTAAQLLSGDKSHSKITLLRRLTIVLARYVTTHSTYSQIQLLLGPPLRVVRLWGLIQGIKWHTVELNEQDASDQIARLVFLGPPPMENEKVVVYIPGGGYVNPITPNTLSFWSWVQGQLDGVRVCVLLYHLRPSSVFPAPLVDALLALQYIKSLHIPPENIQIAGDSAGGHLVLQVMAVLAGTMKIPTVPLPFRAGQKLGGILLMSPWVCLGRDEVNGWDDRYDTLAKETYNGWGAEYVNDVKTFFASNFLGPPMEAPLLAAFTDPHLAASSPNYFAFLPLVTSRVLVTSGERESMGLSGVHKQLVASLRLDGEHKTGKNLTVRLLTQSEGVHGDPMLEFVWWFRGLGRGWGAGMGEEVVDWLRVGFA